MVKRLGSDFKASFPDINIVTPPIPRILKILDPTILPIAILFSFFIAAIIDVATSGREVPNAKTPKPIMVSRIPKYLAKSIDPTINNLAPKDTPIKPNKNNVHVFDKDKFSL